MQNGKVQLCDSHLNERFERVFNCFQYGPMFCGINALANLRYNTRPEQNRRFILILTVLILTFVKRM